MTFARTDANQQQIVKDLRKLGYSVQSLASVGDGCPDLLIGLKGKINLLVELKNGAKAESGRKLTPDEVKWHDNWKGQVVVCKDLFEILAYIHDGDL